MDGCLCGGPPAIHLTDHPSSTTAKLRFAVSTVPMSTEISPCLFDQRKQMNPKGLNRRVCVQLLFFEFCHNSSTGTHLDRSGGKPCNCESFTQCLYERTEETVGYCFSSRIKCKRIYKYGFITVNCPSISPTFLINKYDMVMIFGKTIGCNISYQINIILSIN